MQDREPEYCDFRGFKILISSWNIDSSKPGHLSGIPDNQNFLGQCLTSVEAPDVIIFGWQEVIDLNDKKLTASELPLPFIKSHLLKRRVFVIQKPCCLETRSTAGVVQIMFQEPTVTGKTSSNSPSG